jgi:hypothetical protein
MSTIWETELALGGIHHGDSKKSVLERLGKPESIDDPTKFKFSNIVYPDLTVTLGEGGDGVIFVVVAHRNIALHLAFALACLFLEPKPLTVQFTSWSMPKVTNLPLILGQGWHVGSRSRLRKAL